MAWKEPSLSLTPFSVQKYCSSFSSEHCDEIFSDIQVVVSAEQVYFQLLLCPHTNTKKSERNVARVVKLAVLTSWKWKHNVVHNSLINFITTLCQFLLDVFIGLGIEFWDYVNNVMVFPYSHSRCKI